MNLINPPDKTPEFVAHKTFFSKLINNEIGYNIYLPPEYLKNEKRYPVLYHLHGWKGNESSDIWKLEKAYKKGNAIVVFANGTSDNGYINGKLPMESIIITELMPHIDANYRTEANRENRVISGFSMGGAGAFYYAVKYSELFGEVTAYAATFHHFYNKNYHGVGEPAERAAEFYEKMMKEDNSGEFNIINILKQCAGKIRSNLKINLVIGTGDILICDNEIMHFYLDSLDIPHGYRKIADAGHELEKITQ